MIIYKKATKNNISSILELQAENLVTNLKDDEKDDGFVTTPFTKEQIENLIEQNGVFIALKDEEVVSYVMCASWQYWVA